MTKPVQMRLGDETLAKIDGARGSLTRTEFVRRAVEEYVAEERAPSTPALRPARQAVPTDDSSCAHPKNRRKSLGYAIRCEACGKIVK